MNKKKLIVNADDFGQSEGINRGIIRAHEKGIVTSASLMVRYPAAINAATYARNNPALGVGIHFDLGEWFFRNGNWDPLYEVVSLDDLKALQEEIDRQLVFFYTLMDKSPTHIDSHQHVHLREALRPFFLDVAARLNITLRRCGERVNYCGNFYGQLSDGSPYHEVISVEGLKQIISSLPDGITELACHPGLNDDMETMYSAEREIEVETLCNEEIRETIIKTNIELCSFRGILF